MVNFVILAHDARTWNHMGYAKISNVSIGKRTFIGYGSLVLPNVAIGDDVIIGAGSVVTEDMPDGVVAAGNPATIISSTLKFITKHKSNFGKRPHWTLKGWTIKGGGISDQTNI